jgi:DNA-binding winged helix-turn-helix (wHTH) protein/alpha-beta hydrolase superfamily lysophospholipase
MEWRIGEAEIDVDRREVRRAGAQVAVEPQVFDVLVHLVEHRDRVVTKEELLDTIWGDRFVSESALTSRVKAARRAIGDDGRSQRLIRTHHGRGYRFVGEVEALEGATPAADGTTDGMATRPATHGPAATHPARGPVRYARSGDVNVAFQISGDGPIDIVLVPGFVSHLALDWTEPRHARFLDRLGRMARLIRFDKRGTGLSDRPSEVADLETRMDDLRAVMDAAGSQRAVLFGYSEGGPMCVLFAATYPERCAALALYGTYAKRIRSDDYPWAPTAADRRAYAEELEHNWDWEADMRIMCPSADDELARWWGERCRASASPGAARRLVEMNSLVDVRDTLASVRVPALVLHRVHDRDSRVEEGRYIAERLPDARFVELAGGDHFVAVDPDQILDPVEHFLAELRPAVGAEWTLATVLALRSARLDALWPAVQDAVARARGWSARADDEVLATFDGPSRAVRCAVEVARASARNGSGARIGLHAGEVRRDRRRLGGPAVRLARAAADSAGDGDVVVTRSVLDLVPGSGIEFQPRGTLEHGIELHAVVSPPVG